MGYVIAGQTISLDGFVADANGSAEPLYPDLAALRGSAYMNAMIEETGAVVMGRRSFEMPDDPDSLADSYEFQAPIFVVTHHPPLVTPKENERLTFTFVTDGVESAVAQATAAAREKAVTVVGGVDVIQQLLHAGLVDELRVDVMPVLLGAGLRFLDDSSLVLVDLEKIGVEQVGARTSLRFRVSRVRSRRATRCGRGRPQPACGRESRCAVRDQQLGAAVASPGTRPSHSLERTTVLEQSGCLPSPRYTTPDLVGVILTHEPMLAETLVEQNTAERRVRRTGGRTAARERIR